MQTVRCLVPNFIIQKYNANELRGAFQGAAIFVDLSGNATTTPALRVAEGNTSSVTTPNGTTSTSTSKRTLSIGIPTRKIRYN